MSSVMRSKKLLICILFFALSARLALATSYKFITFNSGNFFATNFTNAIVEGPDGFIWVATTEGFHKFDRMTSIHYFRQPGEVGGLIDNDVRSLAFDDDGYLWLATANGLSRFEPKTSRFYNYSSELLKSDSIPNDHVNVVKVDVHNNVWLGTKQGIAVKFSGKQTFERIKQAAHLNKTNISDIVTIGSRIWVSTYENGMSSFDLGEPDFFDFDVDKGLKSNSIQSLSHDSKGGLWIAYNKSGISHFNIDKNQFSHYSSKVDGLADNKINYIKVLSNGEVWIAVNGFGLSVLDPSTGKFENVKGSNIGDYNLNDNNITNIFQDSNNNIWLSTHNSGVLFLSHTFLNVSDYRLHDYDWSGLTSDSVWATTIDSKSRIWIGTNDKLHIIDLANNVNLTPFDFATVYDVLERKNGQIWVATSSGLHHINHKLQVQRSFFIEPTHPLNSVSLLKLFESKSEHLWIGTYAKGAMRFNDTSQTFDVFPVAEKDQSLESITVSSFAEDSSGRLWLGTLNGLYSFDDKKSQYTRFNHDIRNIWSLTYTADTKSLWAGTTGEGIKIIDLRSESIKQISQKDGLAGNSVLCLIEDNSFLWAATNNGLSRIDERFEIRSYFNRHGLQDGYNYNACEKSAGRLFFGGGTGLSYFEENKISMDASKPKVNITSFNVLDNKSNSYVNMLNTSKPSLLEHEQNNVDIHFSGIYFTWPNAITYQYRLLGQNNEWLEVDRGPSNQKSSLGSPLTIRYTNLAYNNFKFEIKAKSPDGVWSDVTSLSFSIMPPWWQTTYAYFLYFLIVLLGIIGLIKLRTNGLLKQRDRLEQQVLTRTNELQEQTKRAESLSREKDNLFSNVSHEFRTPLTLIMASAEDISKESTLFQKSHAEVIADNALRLLNMVESLIEFARTDGGGPLKQEAQNVSKIANSVFAAFSSMFVKRNISTEVNIDKQVWARFEPDGLEKTLINLIANAIKFTPIGTQIKCSIEELEDNARITICDNGPGIAEVDKQHIFKRFYRGTNIHSIQSPGSGIGLALISDLVARNGGTIELDESYVAGCKFIVTLPKLNSFDTENQSYKESSSIELLRESNSVTLSKEKLQQKESIIQTHSIEPEKSVKEVVLIIEDNIELQNMLAETLNQHFTCVQALSGEEGLIKSKDVMPDVIITDVMMAGISGFDVLHELKSNFLTCHIPVIVMTALNDDAHRLEGWNKFADDYIAKPFNRRELLARLTSILANRRILRNCFDKPDDSELQHLSKNDLSFVSRFRDAIESAYPSTELSRGDVAKQLFMSERQLNRKMSALFDYNFSEYLKKYRLKKALDLLNQGINITQISERVGFTSLAYFSTCFKDEFGLSIKKYERKVKDGELVKGERFPQ